MNRSASLMALALYVALFFLLFPWYQHVLDIDAISYLHVAERYASGDWQTALNGYWSPLFSWILVPLVHVNIDLVVGAKYVNALIGLLTLVSCFRLFARFPLTPTFQRVYPFALVGMVLSFVFYELCADLLQLWLLILYLDVVIRPNWIRRKKSVITAAVLAALGYYAKAYTFPFFMVHFPIAIWLELRRPTIRVAWLEGRSTWFLGMVVFLLLTMPYVAAISSKYGSFRINNAGKLNTSWFLSPGLSDQRKLVAEPPYTDATSYWDDPTYAQEKFVGPFTSMHFFAVQVKWWISNVLKFAGLLNQISVFAFLILLGFGFWLYRTPKLPPSAWQLGWMLSLYPAGYLLIFIEWRYIWIIPVLLLLLAGILLYDCLQSGWLHKVAVLILTLILPISLLVQPMQELQDLRYNNRDTYALADAFKARGIKGKFLLNYQSFPPYGKTVVLCYLTGSQLYGPAVLDYTIDEFRSMVEKHAIDYYLFYYQFPSEREAFLSSPHARMGTRVYDDIHPGVIVVSFQN